MSTKSVSSKPKTTTKTKAKTAPKSKPRLAVAKPPKSRSTASESKTVSKSNTTTAVASPDKAPTSKLTPVTDTTADAAPSELKKRELIEMVVARSEVKKKYAKPVVEALLEVLGDTLASGREMNLQPLGKVKYNRSKETPSSRVFVAKIRQSKAASASVRPVVADTSE